MNLKNKPPIFVPAEFRPELEKMSKAALMDLVWDFAVTATHGNENNREKLVIETLRERRDIILEHRKNPQ